MADTWQTVERAAVALGMSVRTINRHLAAGKLPSRLIDGRREVLVSVPDPVPQTPVEPEAIRIAVREAFARLNAAANDLQAADAQAFDLPASDDIVEEVSAEPTPRPTVRAQREQSAPSAQPHNSEVNTVLALADSASDKAELAVSAYQTLARLAEARGQSSVRGARLAWSIVAILVIATTTAVGWTAHHLTRSRVEAEHLRAQLSSLSVETASRELERDALQRDLSAAREEAARVAGKLEMTTEENKRLEAQVAVREKPRTMLQHWTSLWGN